jgi:hypothetical protein
MRRLLGTLVLILFTAVLVIGQGKGKPEKEGKDDHDDKAPMQAGYAVVTPAAGATAGLVAFETFGLRGHGSEGGASQAGVLPSALTTSAMMFVESSGRLSKDLGVAIVNPNDSDVNVTMTLRTSDGSPVATTSIPVPSHQQVSKFVTELFSNRSAVPSDFMGTLTLAVAGSNPAPVSMIGLRFRGSNFSTLPVTGLSSATTVFPAVAPAVGGAGALLLPQFATGGGWATELILANSGTGSLTVRVDLFKNDGMPLTATLNGETASSFTNLVIPAGGVLTLAPRDRNGDSDF